MNKLYAFTLGMIAFGNCHAQSSSELIDQIFNDLGTPENYSNASIDTASLFAPMSSGDSDIGDQLILKRFEPAKTPIIIKLNNNVYYSSNFANVTSNKEDGFLNHTKLHAEWTKPLEDNWYANLSFKQNLYLYEGEGNFDFTHSEFSAGVIKFVEPADFTINSDLIFDYASEDFFGDEVYQRIAFYLAASKTFLHSAKDNSYLVASIEADLYSSIDSLKRNELSFRAGHQHKFNNVFSVNVFSKLSHYFYEENDRQDSRLNLGLAFKYKLAGNFDLTSSINYIGNRSDAARNDYETFLASVGLGIKGTF